MRVLLPVKALSMTILAVNFALLLVAMLLLWRIAVAIGDVSFIDSVWAFAMVGLALATWLQSYGAPPRKALLLALTALWGLRLGTHLLLRWRREGPDPRYVRILGQAISKRGWSFSRASLQLVFALQLPLLFIVALPAQLGQLAVDPANLGWLAALGSLLALTGIGFEAIGDHQLRLFRANPANRGKVLDTGLWRYTRHPNYFGDACCWWGIWLVAAETTWGWFALPGPLLLSVLLIKWSGVPLLEKGMARTRPGYSDYVARTSSFLPWPPRR